MTRKTKVSNPPAASDRTYFFIQSVIRMLVRMLSRCEVIGAENMPRHGAYVVTSNHLSFFDAPLVYISCPLRMRVFAADKWRPTPVLGPFMEMVGAIWVARGAADREALKAALELLKAGGRLGMAPEGTRSRTGGLQPARPGAAYIVDRARVPIVPMAISGTEKVLRSWARLRRPRLRVAIGAPYYLPGEGRARGEQLDALSDLVMCHIAVHLPPGYRGVFAEHPVLQELLAEQSQPAA
jgi:1-acyl-sn-glycerol-3-phosphate acyltransferase